MPQPHPDPPHRYNTRGISPKEFLCEVYWDQTVDLADRMKAAEAAGHLIVPGDFREPDLSYRIPPLDVIQGGLSDAKQQDAATNHSMQPHPANHPTSHATMEPQS